MYPAHVYTLTAPPPLQTLVILYFVYGVLAIYLDNVVPNEMGVSRPMWYFLLPGYWMPQQVDSSKALTKVRGCGGLGCRRWLQE